MDLDSPAESKVFSQAKMLEQTEFHNLQS